MEDLYGTTPSSATGMASESEDIANILNHLLQSSSSSSPPSSSSFTAFRAKYAQSHQPTSFPDASGGVPGILGSQERVRFARSENRTEPDCRPVEASSGAGSSGFGFSDPTGGLNAFSDAHTSLQGRRISPENDFGDFSGDSEGAEASDVPSNSAPAPRSSSKRSRAAEVHNMSEKRRRSRINEKMKALQNLIPNSNKTDKASMLDEAIEYLKQLQLQVQMLTMRNGLSLHPMCLPMQLPPPQTGLGFNEVVKFPSLFSGHEDSAVQPTFALSNACTISTQPVVLPSEGSLVFEQPTQTRFRPVNLQTSTSEIRDEGKQLARSSPKSPDI